MLSYVPIVVVALVVSSIVGLVSGLDVGMCTYHSNRNITAENIQSPTYVNSTENCCNLCALTAGCKAAVFNEFLCSLKASTENTPAIAGTVVSTMAATTSIPSTTTAPATTEVPPPVPQNKSYAKITWCEYSDRCDPVVDGSCTLTYYEQGVCYQGKVYTCENGYIQESTHSGKDCNGTVKSTAQIAFQPCHFARGDFHAAECVSLPNPTAGLTLKNLQCQNGCGAGGECVRNFETTGQCRKDSDAKGEIPNCYDGFVTWTKYTTGDCSGTPRKIVAELSGQCLVNGGNTFYENTCS